MRARTTVPSGPLRTCTRSQTWLTIHRPQPPSDPARAGGGPRADRRSARGRGPRTRASPRRARPQHAAAAAVPGAVAGQLVDREDEVLARRSPRPGALGGARDVLPDLRQPVELEGVGLGGGRRRREGRVERRQQPGPAEGLAPARRPRRRPADGCAGLVHDRGLQPALVVRAHEPETLAVGERDVQQRLVELALDDLGRAPARPDRLADPRVGRPCCAATKSRHTGMIRFGLAPTRHIDEPTSSAPSPSRSSSTAIFSASPPRAPAGPPESIPDERQRPREKPVAALVDQRFVLEGHRWRGLAPHLRRRRQGQPPWQGRARSGRCSGWPALRRPVRSGGAADAVRRAARRRTRPGRHLPDADGARPVGPSVICPAP